MSNFDGQHLIEKFDSKKSGAISGQRLAKVGYKTTKDKTTGQTIAPKYLSVCASVPYLSNSAIEANIARLLPYIKNMVENAQDGVIRSLYESSDGMLTAVTDQDISLDAVIGFLEAESSGGRLTKEFIEAWYLANVHDTVYLLLAEKLGYEGNLTPEQDATIGRHTKGYKDMFASLAGGKTFYQPNLVKKLRKVLELSSLVDSDDTAAKLDARLAKMLEVKPIEELVEL